MQASQIGNPGPRSSLPYEGDFLCDRINGRNRPSGSHRSEHGRWKAWARSCVEDSQTPTFRKPLERSNQRHAVEYVVNDKVRRSLPCAEAVDPIPSVQLSQVSEQLLDLRVIDCKSELPSAILKPACQITPILRSCAAMR